MVTRKFQRSVGLLSAAVLTLLSLAPVITSQKVGAYGLLTSREIRMATSAASATDVTYLVRVTTPSNSNIGGMVIDFCSNSPIIGDSCTAPTGFDINEAGLALANQTGITDFAIDAATDANTLILARTAAMFNAGTLTLELGSTGGTDGVTNPNTSNATFYARILTYTTTAGAQGYAPATPGAEPPLVHAGGVALSTADEITIQSKVQERLTFCVYTSAVNYANCTVSTTNPVVLGDTNGVLDPGSNYVSKDTKYNVSTNASNGVTIRAKGATLTSGSFTISAIGATPATSSVGSEQFGFCTYRDIGGGTTGLTPTAGKYDGDVGGGVNCEDTAQGQNGDGTADFAFDLSTACGATAANANFGEGNLSCRYGDAIAAKTAGNMSTGIIAFIGNISNTTEPGIYTTTMTFVATGNY
jgi:hypothetical protein